MSFVLVSSKLGGGELFTVRLATALAELRRVRFYGMKGSPVQLLAARSGLEVHPIELGQKLSRRTALLNVVRWRRAQDNLRAVVQRETVRGLVVLQYKWEELLWGGSHCPGRVVLIEHGAIAPELLRLPILRTRLRAAFQRAHTVFVVGPSAAAAVASVAPRETVGLRAGVDLPTDVGSTDRRTALRSALGVTDSQRLVAYVGRVVKEKGALRLPDLLARQQRLVAVVAGEGPALPHLMARARKLGVENRCRVVGWVENPVDYLAAADVAVLLSTRPEGRPLSVLEAVSVGTPVVVSDSSPPLTELALEFPGGVFVADGADDDDLVRVVDYALSQRRRVALAPSWNAAAERFIASVEGVD